MDDDPAKTSIVCAARAFRVDTAKLQRLGDRIKARLGVGSHQLSVALVGERRIRTLNREFRGKDRSTDVLSFPQAEWRKPLLPSRRPAPRLPPSLSPWSSGRPSRPRRKGGREDTEHLGDIAISLPNAAANARRIGQPLDREVCFLLVHGILHLCGHDHEDASDERRMLKAQRTLMTELGGRGTPAWSACVRARRARAGRG